MPTATIAPTRPAGSAPVDVSILRSRAADLRLLADELDGPLAVTYRRRASELELEAAARAARYGVADPIGLAA